MRRLRRHRPASRGDAGRGLGGTVREYTASFNVLALRLGSGFAQHLERRVQHRGGHQAQLGARRVVRRAACPARAARRRRGPCSGSPAAASMRARVSTPGRSSTGVAARAVDDARLDADVAGAAVEHRQRRRRTRRRTCAARGRADAAEAVRARRGDAGHAERGAAASSARATGCDGQRRPMRAWPPAAASAMPARARHDHASAGPGQNAAIRRCATGGKRAAKAARLRGARPRARSADGRPAGPWRRRSSRPRASSSARAPSP